MPVPAPTHVPSSAPPACRSRRNRSRRGPLVALGLASCLGLVAIGCGSSTTATSSTTSTPSTTAATSTGSSASGTTAAGTGSTAKVSANTASAAEIQAALTAAGVTNAARWTKEIEEYRPYPTDDPKLAKLRKELAKYNPSADQLEKILGALQP